MKCNKCQIEVTKVEDVLHCPTCSRDGTANEIPKGMAEDAELTAVLSLKPGLAARFIVSPPAADKVEPVAEKVAKRPKATKKPKSKDKAKAKAKARARRRS